MSAPDRALIPALRGLGRPRVAVIGDFMLDRYVWGDAQRVSPEAPVPVVRAHREEERLGGAGNVAANLGEMGAQVTCFGTVGRDASGERLAAMLAALGAGGDGLLACAERPTVQKIRVMARNQQMLRVDREEPLPVDAETAARLLAALEAATWDALVLSDYGKGTLPPELTAEVLRLARARGVPSLVDPKHRDLARYRGAFLVTPNRAEAEDACGAALDGPGALAEHGERLRAEAGVDALLITLGGEGMFLLRAGGEAVHLPTAARQVYDVTGAGDTVIATLATALGGGLGLEQAVGLANAAAGLAVAKVGTTAVGREELLHALHASTADAKLAALDDPAALDAALAAYRRAGLRVVFTNGCFDILHAGHVRYLREARRRGDVLVVGLNDDDSVRRLKGAGRPYNALADRAEVLAGLESVDLVVAFAEDAPEELIRRVQPHVLAKGADWKDKGVAGAEWVRASGGEVEFIELVPGRSTSGLAQRIRGR